MVNINKLKRNSEKNQAEKETIGKILRKMLKKILDKTLNKMFRGRRGNAKKRSRFLFPAFFSFISFFWGTFFFIFTSFMSTFSYAGIGESMASYWKDMGTVVNVSHSGSYQGQSAGYYTLGNIYARTPVRTSSVAQIDLPKARSGCGGIDLFKGALSFISMNQLEETLKSIASNGGGFAFQVAMATISPMLAQKIEEFQSWIQEINAMNINSCETAAALVGGIWPKHDRASATICSTLGNGDLFNDYVKAKHACEGGGRRAEVNREMRDKYPDLAIDDINLAWEALKKSPMFKGSTLTGERKKLAELFMTLSGTIIIEAPKNDELPPRFKYISSRIDHTDLLTALLEGGTIKAHVCNGSEQGSGNDSDKCLSIIELGSEQIIDEEHSFKFKVKERLTSMMEKVTANEKFNNEEREFLQMTTIPIYKILNVHAAYEGAGSVHELPVFAEAIALQLLYDYLQEILKQMEIASDQLKLGGGTQVGSFKKNLFEARKALSAREIKTHQNFDQLMKVVDRTKMLERILLEQSGSSSAQALNF